MISVESGYLKDLANNILNTERHSLEPLDVLLLIDVILTQRGQPLELPINKPLDLAGLGETTPTTLEQETSGH